MDKSNYKNDKQFDRLLDDALADYSNVQPRSGLDERILARLASNTADAEVPRSTWLRWWPALSIAAAALIVFAIILAWPKAVNKVEVKQTPPEHLNTTAPRSTSNSPELAAVSKNAIHRHPTTQRANISAATASQPPQLAIVKQDVFPAPSPLTDQEKLLFAYLRKTPSQELISQAKPDPPADDFQQQNNLRPTRPSDLNLGK